LIEQEFRASEFRVFISRRGEYAVLHRDPAHVFGDGERPVRELAHAESYRRMNPRASCLAPLVLDDIALRFLARSGRTVDDVPVLGEKVYLRNSSNVATGAVAADVTASVHTSVLDLCAKALSLFPSLPYVGVDFMTHDISAPQTAASYRIVELNTNPSIGMHHSPGLGRPRDVVRVIADLIFPETTPARVYSGYSAIE
jgi:cyanophycin synthetase